MYHRKMSQHQQPSPPPPPEAPLENTSARSRRTMQLVAERQIPDRPEPPVLVSQPVQPSSTTPTARTAPSELSRELMSRAAWRAGVIGGINVLVAVLAVRLILLLAVAG